MTDRNQKTNWWAKAGTGFATVYERNAVKLSKVSTGV